MIKLLNGVKSVKLDTVEVNIYLSPPKLNNDSTLSLVATYSPVKISILSYVASNPYK